MRPPSGEIRAARSVGQNQDVPRVVTPDAAESRRQFVSLQARVAELERQVGRQQTELAALRESDRRTSETLARIERLMTSTRRGE